MEIWPQGYTRPTGQEEPGSEHHSATQHPPGDLPQVLVPWSPCPPYLVEGHHDGESDIPSHVPLYMDYLPYWVHVLIWVDMTDEYYIHG